MSNLAATDMHESEVVSLQQPPHESFLKHNLPDLSYTFRCLLLTAFVLINFSLFITIASVPIFASVREDLLLAFGLFFGVASLASVMVAGVPLFKRVAEQVYNRTITFEALCLVNLLFASCLTISWLIQDYEAFALNLSAEYLITSAFLIFVVFHIRGMIWARSERILWGTVAEQVPEVQVIAPEEVPDPNHTPKISSEKLFNVRVGDVVSFEANQMVPFDCLILEGIALVTERELTNRAVQRQKQTGEIVYAGSRIRAGKLVCRVECLADESRITTFYPEDEKPSIVYTEPRVLLFLGVVAFIGAFFTLYWQKQEMLLDTIEPVLGSFLVLTLFVEWFALQKLVSRMQRMILFRVGAILKEPALLAAIVKLKKLILRTPTDGIGKEVAVERIELLDDRLDRPGILSILFGMYSAIENESSEAVLKYISGALKSEPVPVAFDNLMYYEDKGFFAIVNGVEFSIGNEGFLIERGVQLNATELETEPGEEVHLVALNDVLVGIVHFGRETHTLRDAAIDSGVRVQLGSSAPQKDIDTLGKSLGLELADLYGNENLEDSLKRLETQEGVAVALLDGTDSRIVRSRILTIAPFNRLLFDGSLSDVTLIDAPVSEFLQALKSIKTLAKVEYGVNLILPILLAVCVVPISLALLSSEVVLTVCAASYLILLWGVDRTLSRIA